jgi:hypothetical protein
MEQEGLPNFISAIVAAVILGAMVLVSVLLHAVLTMPA